MNNEDLIIEVDVPSDVKPMITMIEKSLNNKNNSLGSRS
jgi:hypothetical protein